MNIINGQDVKKLVYGVDYTVEDYKVLLQAPPEAAKTVCVYRQTPTNAEVTWVDSSVLKAYDMNKFQIQILHILEESADQIMIADDEWDGTNRRIEHLQIERLVKLADGVTVNRGTIIGYKAGGFIIADNKDYSTLQNIMVALEDNQGNMVKALEVGEFLTTSYQDGSVCFVGSKGQITTTQPTESLTYIKCVGYVEGTILHFKPDSLSICLE